MSHADFTAALGMDHNNLELLRDPGGEPGLLTDSETSESFSPEKEQRRCTSCVLTEDLSTDGSWSQRSISRSLQRAETLLRSTFNPSLKWLFHVRSQDDEEDKEGNFVLAHNLVSRSSARLLRLQQALLTVAPQWQPVGGPQTGSPQVCVKSLSAEGVVLLLPSSSSLQEIYSALRRLQEQRSLLLFIHEFSRRAHLAAAFISRVTHLLEREHLRLRQAQSNCSWFRVTLSSMSQELRVHLSHWSCLLSKVQSDQNLRAASVQQTRLLLQVRQSLELLGLQALVLMERYVYLVLCAVVRTDLDSVPREVLEDVLAGTELYNQTVGEQRAQHSTTQQRTTILQQAQNPALGPGLPPRRGRHPAGLSIRELMVLLAEHHTEQAAQQLHSWTSEQVCHTCPVHKNHTGPDPSAGQVVRCRTRTLRSEWTWEQLQHTYFTASVTHQPLLQPSAPHISSHQTPPGHLLDLCLDQEHHCPETASVQHRTESSNRDQTSPCQKPTETGPEALVSDRQTNVETSSPQSGLSGVQQDRLSVELLIQMLVSSGELLAPLTSQTPEYLSLNTGAEESLVFNPAETEPNQDQHVDGPGTENTNSSGVQAADPHRQVYSAGSKGVWGPPVCTRFSPSVQWLDLGQSVLVADVLGQYRPLLVTLCSRALWLQLLAPPAGTSAGSINLQDPHSRFSILKRVRLAAKTDLLPKESRALLEDLSLYLLASTAHVQWDYEVCSSLGSALNYRCLKGVNHLSSSEQDGGAMMSLTMEHFLCLSPPLMSSLSCCQSLSRSSGALSPLPSRMSLHRLTVSLALATVQLSSVWVMSKSFQFLSSWSLNKFLLVAQGDLKVLTDSFDLMLHQTLTLTSDRDNQSSLHHQLLLRRQLRDLDGAVSNLQTFSAVVLKTFSTDCKRMSGEIFEQTMPAAVHWRPSLRTGFPSSPSDYASLAAQTVIGQVLEGVAPLSDDARVQALSITMTAFMEAWMEHILRHRIKFSVQGALQLKQDFDSIREMIQSDKYGLSADLHHRLLSLRVFQQVDSAVVCLLQQPQAKPYLQSRAWEPFTHCCPGPAHSSRDSIDSVVGSSITNLRCMEGEELTHTDPSVMTSDLPPVDPSTSREPYLAPSAALGAAQQDWLDLRIHSTARRWRLPGLHCLSKSEP
uniref:uncharacterized protein ccdc142 n=1 Tax=Semicossyphus pulcher TaxID=241346 RepID=UPI0037E6FEAB